MPINLPNQITLGRLVLTTILFVLLAQFDVRNPNTLLMHIAFWLFVVAALTDVLDGYLARKKGLVTSFGRIIDPFVDKILVCGTFVFFLDPNFIDQTGRNATDVQAWMVVLILGREMLITGLRGFAEKTGIAFGANVYGKVKMLIQSFTAGFILFSLAIYASDFGRFLARIRPTLVWITVIVTVLSMIAYLYRARGILTEQARA
jgi:CDP-diacylglycerol---glycerol-3-phosphate 3-phosphatidyltransferase